MEKLIGLSRHKGERVGGHYARRRGREQPHEITIGHHTCRGTMISLSPAVIRNDTPS